MLCSKKNRWEETFGPICKTRGAQREVLSILKEKENYWKRGDCNLIRTNYTQSQPFFRALKKVLAFARAKRWKLKKEKRHEGERKNDLTIKLHPINGSVTRLLRVNGVY